jgi:hypothetical protein
VEIEWLIKKSKSVKRGKQLFYGGKTIVSYKIIDFIGRG